MTFRVFWYLFIASLFGRSKNVAHLIYEYERLFRSGERVGNNVIYPRYTVKAMRETFTRIMEEV